MRMCETIAATPAPAVTRQRPGRPKGSHNRPRPTPSTAAALTAAVLRGEVRLWRLADCPAGSVVRLPTGAFGVLLAPDGAEGVVDGSEARYRRVRLARGGMQHAAPHTRVVWLGADPAAWARAVAAYPGLARELARLGLMGTGAAREREREREVGA